MGAVFAPNFTRLRLDLSRRLGLAVAGGLAVLSCSEFTKPAAKSGGNISLVPAFSAAALASGPALSSLGLTVDHVHIVLRDPVSLTTILLDTTIAVPTGTDSLSLELTVPANPGQTLSAGLDFESGSTTPPTILFSGTAIVTAHAIGSAITATTGDTIHVVYVGPGSGATQVQITPNSGNLPAFHVDTLTAVAQDASKSSLSTPILWSVDDTLLATVSVLSVANNVSTALLTPKGNRGTINVTATALNGISVSAKILLVTGASTIVVDTSSLNQFGTVGTALGKPMLVLVQTADGSVVPNQTVTFTASGNASITASAITDATGHAKATPVLGTLAGTYTYTATAGSASALMQAGAVAGNAKKILKVSGDANSGSACTSNAAVGPGCDTVTKRLSAPFVVQVQDSLGNAVAGASVTWTRTLGTGTLRSSLSSTPSFVTGVDGQTANEYILGSTVGATDSIKASIGSGASVMFAATALAGPPGTLPATRMVIFGDTVVVVTNQTLPTDFPYVAVTDSTGRGIGGFSITAAATSAPAGFSNPCPSSNPCTITTDAYGVVVIPKSLASNGTGLTVVPGNYTIVVSSPSLTPNKPGAKAGDPFTFYVTVK